MYVSNTIMLFSLYSLHMKPLVKTKQNVYMMNEKKRGQKLASLDSLKHRELLSPNSWHLCIKSDFPL